MHANPTYPVCEIPKNLQAVIVKLPGISVAMERVRFSLIFLAIKIASEIPEKRAMKLAKRNEANSQRFIEISRRKRIADLG